MTYWTCFWIFEGNMKYGGNQFALLLVIKKVTRFYGCSGCLLMLFKPFKILKLTCLVPFSGSGLGVQKIEKPKVISKAKCIK